MNNNIHSELNIVDKLSKPDKYFIINPLLNTDVSNLKKIIISELWNDLHYPFKNHFQSKFRLDKPIVLLFCNQNCTKFYETHYFTRFNNIITPLLTSLFGNNFKDHIGKLQFTILRPGGIIRFHEDVGKWASDYNRIHIAIHTNDSVKFYLINNNGILEQFLIAEGQVVEINNTIGHMVINDGQTDRIHMIIDYSKDKIPYQRISIDKYEVMNIS